MYKKRSFLHKMWWGYISIATVDGRYSAAVDMDNIPLFTEFHTSNTVVVSRISEPSTVSASLLPEYPLVKIAMENHPFCIGDTSTHEHGGFPIPMLVYPECVSKLLQLPIFQPTFPTPELPPPPPTSRMTPKAKARRAFWGGPRSTGCNCGGGSRSP